MGFSREICYVVALTLCCSSALAPAIAAEGAQGTSAPPSIKYERYSATYDVNVDGTYAERYEWAMRVLDEQGVTSAKSTSIAYAERLHDIQIIEAYSVSPDGRRIDASPNNYRVLQAGPGKGRAGAWCPDHKAMTVLFPDVVSGSLVVFSYRRVQKQALFPDQFSLALPLSRSEVYDDVQIRLSVPESMALHVFSRDVDGGQVKAPQGRREWLWSFRNAKRADSEDSHLPWPDAGPLVLATTFDDYQMLGAAYEVRSRPKVAVTERVQALADELTEGAHTPRAQVKAFYDWVSKNIRFVGSCWGSVVPRDVDRILTSGMGDCKDHAALMQALMDAKRIPNALALIRIGPSVTLPALPVAAAVNHVLNYVPSLDLFVDSSAANVPFGALPPSASNKPVVLAGPLLYGLRETPSIDGPQDWVRTTYKEDPTRRETIGNAGL